jgi:hypothetical protein
MKSIVALRGLLIVVMVTLFTFAKVEVCIIGNDFMSLHVYNA